jgi:hypothetical protein
MNVITNNSFKSKVIGIDPISKGTFTIEHAYMLWDDDWHDPEFPGGKGYLSRARGKIAITSENDNPLHKIAKESPLRLQGLVASVDFGIEKRFIKIQTIGNYYIYSSVNEMEYIKLDPVTFEILDNLEYLENVQTYREDHLI